MSIEMPTVDGLFTTESVTVHIPTTIYDHIGQPKTTWRQETVEGCLVWPGSTKSSPESGRPMEREIAFTVALPKIYTQDITGGQITIRGTSYGVVGSPQAWTPENVPGQWDRTVEVERIDG